MNWKDITMQPLKISRYYVCEIANEEMPFIICKAELITAYNQMTIVKLFCGEQNRYINTDEIKRIALLPKRM